MNSHIKPTIKKLGFCCPFAYFHASRDEKVSVIAMELSACERAVKLWRKRFREGQLQCPSCKGCFIRPVHPAQPQTEPDSPPQPPVNSYVEE